MLTKFFRTHQLQDLKKVFLKEIALANHLHQRFHSLMRCRFLCTNTSSGLSMLRVTVIAVIELFRLYSVKEKLSIHLYATNLSKSRGFIKNYTHSFTERKKTSTKFLSFLFLSLADRLRRQNGCTFLKSVT